MTGNLGFFSTALRAKVFFVILFCISLILLLQHILNINDHTHLVGKLSPGRGTDVLGGCSCFRELSEQKLIQRVGKRAM